MSGFVLSSRSQSRLAGVHIDLRRIVRRAIKISTVDFMVTDGLRSLARQRELLAQGATWTLRSRHLTGHAVDLAAVVGRRVRWDWPLYYVLRDAMMQAAKEWETPLEWGGDWPGKKADGPHFQLPWSKYPI